MLCYQKARDACGRDTVTFYRSVGFRAVDLPLRPKVPVSVYHTVMAFLYVKRTLPMRILSVRGVVS